LHANRTHCRPWESAAGWIDLQLWNRLGLIGVAIALNKQQMLVSYIAVELAIAHLHQLIENLTSHTTGTYTQISAVTSTRSNELQHLVEFVNAQFYAQ